MNSVVMSSSAAETSRTVVAVSRGPARSRFSCRKCRLRFKTKGGLNLHLRKHQPHIYLIQCPDCPFRTYQKANFAKHSAVQHAKTVEGRVAVPSLTCSYDPTCPFQCHTSEQLSSHTQRKHCAPVDHPFKCDLCPYSSVEKAAVDKHKNIVHKGRRDYPCSLCNFRSQTASGLSRHERSHLEVKPHPCPSCSMTYADKKRLREHVQAKHSPAGSAQFPCPHCKHTTNRKDNLKTHIKRNHMPP